ncbi:DUF6392 family protein [Pseudomonas sp. Marseille-P9899]|uniref:DUF6392 family protein n=1 Tax=Pseudomonas sp. Marseille-P9899 TaxID=2730401 RepID=UPI001588461D|nr:DUF6392 family protein [Pseudomonas sp. Marseille-P9899]
MKIAELEALIGYLGKSHADLIAMSVVPDAPLLQIFPESEIFFFEPEEGVEMSFSPDGKIFTRLFVTLKETTPSTTEYEGELPSGLAMDMDKTTVQEFFGVPKSSHDPVRLPKPTGWTGGWDTYNYDGHKFPGIELIFKYRADMVVETLVFKHQP